MVFQRAIAHKQMYSISKIVKFHEEGNREAELVGGGGGESKKSEISPYRIELRIFLMGR